MQGRWRQTKPEISTETERANGKRIDARRHEELRTEMHGQQTAAKHYVIIYARTYREIQKDSFPAEKKSYTEAKTDMHKETADTSTNTLTASL